MELSEREKSTIRKCLQISLDETVFPDWEYPTLMGETRESVRRLMIDWPYSTKNPERAFIIANNVLVNLLSYPHDQSKKIEAELNLTIEQLETLLRKLRASYQ